MEKINHKPAQDIICDIILRIKKQIKSATTYKAQRLNFETDVRLNDEYRQQSIAKLDSNYLAELGETRAFICEKLEEVAKLEEENDNILDLDVPELSETLSAISTTKGRLPELVISNIFDKFKGNYQVIVTIAAAFKEHGITLDKFNIENRLRTAREVVDGLIVDATNIETSADTSYISLSELLQNIVEWGRGRGMVWSDEFVSLGEELDSFIAKVRDDVATQNARQAMGLD